MSFPRTLILILLFAAGLRLYPLGRASFWYDEFGSLEASTGRGLAQLQLPVNQIITNPSHLTSLENAPLAWRIWTSLDLDNHPPLYFLLLRFTRDVLGDSEWAVRLPSMICSVIALIFFFLIVRTQLSETSALAAIALMAVAGSQITLAQEARPYTLWLALSLACGWLVVRIERLGISPWRWIVLCMLACASLLTHYFAVPILFSLALYAVLNLRGSRRIGVFTALFLAGLIIAVMWGPFFIRQLRAASANNAWQYDDAPNHTAHIILHLIQLPARWLSEPAANIFPLALLIAAGSIYCVIRYHKHPGVLFWLLWSVPLIVLIAMTDMARHAQSLFFMRYTFAAAPALCFLAGVYAQNLRRGWLVPATLGLLCLCTLSTAYSQVMDWRNVAMEIRSQIHPGDTIIFTPGDNPVSWSQSTFMGIFHYAPDLPPQILILTDPNAAVLKTALRPGHAIWVICFDPTIAPNAIDPTAKVVHTGIAKSFGRVSQLLP